MVVAIACLDRYMEKTDAQKLADFTAERRQKELVEDEDGPRETIKLFKQGEDIEENFKFSDLKDFELPFWLTCMSCMCTYISIISSITIGSKVL